MTYTDGSKFEVPLCCCGTVECHEDEEEKPKETPKAAVNRHSPDFRSCTWNGNRYEFTATQAAVVKVLWESWEDGCPSMSQAALLEQADSDAANLRDIFRGNSAWRTMIIQGGKGNYKLADEGDD